MLRRRRPRYEEMPDVVLLLPETDGDRDSENMSMDELPVTHAKSLDGDRSSVGSLVRQRARSVIAGVASARKARAEGPASHGVLSQDRLAGDGREVVQTCRVRPTAMESIVSHGGLFTDPVDRLELADAPVKAGTGDYTWPVRVRTSIVRRRAATLHLSSTPSQNLTVIELRPVKVGRYGKRRFVFRGVRCVHDLARRIEAAAFADC